MPTSMTGFGRGTVQSKNQKYIVEVKSVNNRFCEVRTNTPKEMLKLEHDISTLVRKHFQRGKFDLILKSEQLQKNNSDDVDVALVEKRWKKLDRLRKKLKIKEPLSLEAALGGPHLYNGASGESRRDENPEKFFLKAAEAALANLQKFRDREAKNLVGDIDKRIQSVKRVVQKIEKTVVEHRSVRMDRIRKRIEQLVEGKTADRSRLETEIALLVERADVTEEVVRLKSHLANLSRLMKSKESVGRKMDFLLQEVNREVNTIGAKSADMDISEDVVFVKSEIEKIREQSQNLE